MRKLWSSGWETQVALIVLALVVGATVLAGRLTPFNPLAMDIAQRLQPPSLHHLLGTDGTGRDIFARILYGGRLSLTVGLVAVGIESTVGTFVGLVSGYVGGWLDIVVMRFIDMMLALPGLILALFVVAILGPGLTNVMIALGVGGAPGIARLMRGVTVSVRERDFVTGGIATGGSSARVAVRHVLPNALPPVLALLTLDVGTIILAAAGLSFIGLGAQPPSPEWGAMLAEAQQYFPQAWWLSVFPGVAITIVVLSLNIIGDGLRDILDPWTARQVRNRGA